MIQYDQVAQDNLVARALVRLLGDKGPQGFGLLVAPGKIVSCAHVAALALGREKTLVAPPAQARVRIDFPFLQSGQVRTASIAAWITMSEDGTGDIVGLEIDGEPPDGARPLAISRGGPLQGHRILTYGYQSAASDQIQSWVRGTIVQRTERGWLQLGLSEDTGGLRIRQGFSGSPVYDLQTGQVVGLINQVSRAKDVWLAYAIPGDAVLAAWPELQAYVRQACPYRSLVPFEASDEEIFFGRKEIADEVTADIASGELILITGASGVGKTSLIQAGIKPRLAKRGLACLQIRPLTRGTLWGSLAAALARQPHRGIGSATTLSEDPMQAPAISHHQEELLVKAFNAETLLRRANRICEYLGAERVVVIVDQFEEVLRTASSEAGEFAADLRRLVAVRHPEGGPMVRVVIVARSDVEQQIRTLARYDEDITATIEIPKLDAAQLRSAIEGPIRATGFTHFEKLLVERIISDVAVQPYCLPALQVILTELWNSQAADGLLSHRDYQRLNQDGGPLTTHIERVWNENLGRDDRSKALTLFLHLVLPLEAGGFARRVARRPEIGASAWEAAGVLATQRLVVVSGDDAMVELVHDALIDQWPTLANHLEEHRDFLRWRDDVRRRMTLWQGTAQAPKELIGGQILKQSLQLAADNSDLISESEKSFIAASRRRQRRLRWSVVGTSVLLIVGLLTATFIVQSQRQAEQLSYAQATSRNLARQSSDSIEQNPVDAALLAAAAWTLAPTPEAHHSMLDILAWPSRGILQRDASSAVHAVAALPKRGIVAAGDSSNGIWLWDVNTRQPIGYLVGHTGPVKALAFSANGRILASGSGDASIRLWDTSTWREISPPLKGHEGEVKSVAFNRDGTLLVSAANGDVRLWNVWTHLPAGEPLDDDTADAFEVAFTPNGRMIVTTATDNAVHFWDIESRRRMAPSIVRHTSAVLGLAYSPDGTLLATVSDDTTLRFWDTRTRRQRGGAIQLKSRTPLGIAFNPAGTMVATPVRDDMTGRRSVLLWDVLTHQQIGEPLVGHTNDTFAVVFASDEMLITGSNDGSVRLWNVAVGRPTGTALTSTAKVYSDIAFSRDSRIIATVGDDRAVRVWDARTHTDLGSPITSAEGFSAVAFSPTKSQLATAGVNGEIQLWDLTTRRRMGRAMTGHGAQIRDLAFSPGGNLIATAADDRTVRLWDVHSQLQVGGSIAAINESDITIAFSPKGKTLAVAGDDRVVRLFDTATQRMIQPPIEGHDRPITRVAFDPAGEMIVTASYDGSTRLWNATSGRQLGPSLTNVMTTDLAFSPDGRTLAITGEDEKIRLIDIATRSQTGPELAGHTRMINAVAFSPNGQTLGTAAADGTARLWGVEIPSQPIKAVCAIAGAPMSESTWRHHIQKLPPQPVCAKSR